MDKKANNKQKLIQRLKKILLKEKNIIFAYLLGSFVDEDKFHDIDIAIYLDDRTLKKVSQIDFEISFSIKLEKDIKVPVDSKILNDAPLSFRYHATRGQLLLSRDDSIREEFLRRTWGEYFDFLPVSKIYLKEIAGA